MLVHVLGVLVHVLVHVLCTYAVCTCVHCVRSSQQTTTVRTLALSLHWALTLTLTLTLTPTLTLW